MPIAAILLLVVIIFGIPLMTRRADRRALNAMDRGLTSLINKIRGRS
jgi:hypothetical protein